MYAREHDNKVTIRCNAPSPLGLNQFWKEVQEYMDKGYRFDSESRKPFLEAPVGTTFTRVTLVKEEAKENIKPTPAKEPIKDTPKAATPKKTTAKKPAATK